jgi:hypothetical protein
MTSTPAVPLEELTTQVECLHEDLGVAAVQWLQFRVRGDFIGMGRAGAVIDELCAELTRVERRIKRRGKRANAA